MIFLARFSVLMPDPGLFIWTVIIFFIFWLLVGKLAFKPIAGAIRKRENDIQDALDEARKARTEMEALQANNEALLQEAREERGKILKEAKELKDSIVGDAKSEAASEAAKMLAEAKVEIENQKNGAIEELKREVGKYSLEIAEKVLGRELDSQGAHEDYVSSMVDKIKMN